MAPARRRASEANGPAPPSRRTLRQEREGQRHEDRRTRAHVDGSCRGADGRGRVPGSWLDGRAGDRHGRIGGSHRSGHHADRVERGATRHSSDRVLRRRAQSLCGQRGGRHRGAAVVRAIQLLGLSWRTRRRRHGSEPPRQSLDLRQQRCPTVGRHHRGPLGRNAGVGRPHSAGPDVEDHYVHPDVRHAAGTGRAAAAGQSAHAPGSAS